MQGALIEGIANVKKKAEEDVMKKINDGHSVMRNGVIVYLKTSAI